MSSKNAGKFLEELKFERNKIDELISSIERYLEKNKEEVKTNFFSDQKTKSDSLKSLPEYILEYLAEIGSSCSAEQITKGILKMGVETQSQKFPAMVNTILYQLKKKGKIIAVQRGYWKISNNDI